MCHIEPQTQHHWDHNYTQVDNTVMVSDNARPSDRLPPSAPFRLKKTLPIIQTVKSSPTVSEASTFRNHPIPCTVRLFERN